MACCHSLQNRQRSLGEPSERTPSSKPLPRGLGIVHRIASRGVIAGKYACMLALTLGLVAFMGGEAMAQTPTIPDPGAIPVFVDFTAVLGKITAGLATFIGPVLVFMAGIAIVLMFITWTIGRKKIG